MQRTEELVYLHGIKFTQHAKSWDENEASLKPLAEVLRGRVGFTHSEFIWEGFEIKQTMLGAFQFSIVTLYNFTSSKAWL